MIRDCGGNFYYITEFDVVIKVTVLNWVSILFEGNNQQAGVNARTEHIGIRGPTPYL